MPCRLNRSAFEKDLDKHREIKVKFSTDEVTGFHSRHREGQIQNPKSLIQVGSNRKDMPVEKGDTNGNTCVRTHGGKDRIGFRQRWG